MFQNGTIKAWSVVNGYGYFFFTSNIDYLSFVSCCASIARGWNAALPYVLEIAGKGWKRAMQENKEIRRGAIVIDGRITYKAGR